MESFRIVRAARARRSDGDRQPRARRLGIAALAVSVFVLLALGVALLLPLAGPQPILISGVRPEPSRFYDRTGARFLYQAASGESPASRWFDGEALADSCVLPVFLAARGLSSDTSSGASLPAAVQALTAAAVGRESIAVEAADELIAISGSAAPAWDRARLAGALAARYSTGQLAEWLLNVRLYGRMTVGIDDAALTYFHSHADRLTQSQCITLEALAGRPALADDPAGLAAARENVLRTVRGRMTLMESAGPDPTLAVEEPSPVAPLEPFLQLVFERLAGRYPRQELARAGLRVTTTLDFGLAMQSLCVAQSAVANDGSAVPAPDGTPCDYADSLPSTGTGAPADLAIETLDPETGELLAYSPSVMATGGTASAGETGTAVLPFIYLSAFTRGFGPASMLLDIPDGRTLANPDGKYLGPITAREALQDRRLAATGGLIDQIGIESLLRSLDLLGLGAADGANSLAGLLGQDSNLLTLSGGYAILASGGRRYYDPQDPSRPIVVLRVENDAGEPVTAYSERASRSIVGSDVDFLLTDVLSQNSAPDFGASGGAAAAVGEASDGGWAFLFSSDSLVAAHAVNGSALPAAAAVFGGLLRNRPASGWIQPPGVVRVDVCPPTGLLPGRYCPNTEPELFLAGMEPVQTDTAYRPVAVDSETGRLATLWTPLSLVENKTFLHLSGDALAWAAESGFAVPPSAYDTLPETFPYDAGLHISDPAPLDLVHGRIAITGAAGTEGIQSWVLQAGEGLYPAEWFLIASGTGPVSEGTLGVWDTAGKDGIWSLELTATRQNGLSVNAAIPVTLDNSPPSIRWIEPPDGKPLPLTNGDPVILQADVDDNLELRQVDFYIDGAVRQSFAIGPFSVRWTGLPPGEHTVRICAMDTSGNENCTPSVKIEIRP